MLTNKELKELTKKLENIPQTIPVQVFTAILKNMNLYYKSIDQSALDAMALTAKELVAEKNLDKLNEYLLAIAKMKPQILTEVNIRDVYTTLDIESNYSKKLTQEKILQKNKIRNAKSNKEEEDILLAKSKDLEKSKRTMEISKTYQKMLESYLSRLESIENALKRIIEKRQKEYEFELYRKYKR